MKLKTTKINWEVSLLTKKKKPMILNNPRWDYKVISIIPNNMPPDKNKKPKPGSNSLKMNKERNQLTEEFKMTSIDKPPWKWENLMKLKKTIYIVTLMTYMDMSKRNSKKLPIGEDLITPTDMETNDYYDIYFIYIFVN